MRNRPCAKLKVPAAFSATHIFFFCLLLDAVTLPAARKNLPLRLCRLPVHDVRNALAKNIKQALGVFSDF